MGRVREDKRRRKKIKEEKFRRKKIREKVGKHRKAAKHCVFPMICGSGGWKSRLAKAAGAEPCDQMRDEKFHALVARSTFRSQNVQSTSKHHMFAPLLTLKRRFVWQAQGVLHLVKSEQNVRAL